VAAAALGIYLGRALDGGSAAIGPAVAAAVLVVWVTGALSLIPVAILGPHGVLATVKGYFAGMMVRLPVCLIAALLLHRLAHLPVRPLQIGLAVSYLPLLGVEVGFVARYLWQKDAAWRKAHQTPALPGATLPAASPSPEATRS
jgi:hypothetical protein